MTKLVKNKFVLGTVIILVLIVIGVISFYKGDQFALNNMNFKQVTPTQLANAMKQDDFYSSYRENTVIFSGKVTSISDQGSSALAYIQTSSTYSLTCEVSQNQVKAGNTYTFMAEAYRATRQPSGVLLANCYMY